MVLSEYLTQVMYPSDLAGFGADKFKVFAIKSRVHFRRGFDDSGFAKTILLVEPEQPFLGTVRLDALPTSTSTRRTIPTATSASLNGKPPPKPSGSGVEWSDEKPPARSCRRIHERLF